MKPTNREVELVCAIDEALAAIDVHDVLAARQLLVAVLSSATRRCYPRKRFHTETTALNARDYLAVRGDNRTAVSCNACGGWHLEDV